MYDSSRFFVMTSDYCSEFIAYFRWYRGSKPLHDKYLMQGKNNANSNEKIDFVSPGGQNLILSANEIIKKHETLRIVLSSKHYTKVIYQIMLHNQKQTWLFAI